MNALTTQRQSSALALRDEELIPVLQSSLYPGAKPESIKLVLGYCKAAGLDPMQKPVHLVPMNVKKPGTRDQYEWRDVVMPGIGLYRTQAVRTKELAGISEPEFGPMVEFKAGGRDFMVPEWCRVTVFRMVNGEKCPFVAMEFWEENYATAGRDSSAPNAMWKKRPRGQIAKCAEAQALRKAFPELLGGTNTSEEMEGKTVDEGAVIDITPQAKPARTASAALDNFSGQRRQPEPPRDEPPPADFEDGEGLGIPEIPEQAMMDWTESKKWMAAWKWISMNLCEMPEGVRPAFVAANSEIISAIAGYSAQYAKSVHELMERAGVHYGNEA